GGWRRVLPRQRPAVVDAGAIDRRTHQRPRRAGDTGGAGGAARAPRGGGDGRKRDSRGGGARRRGGGARDRPLQAGRGGLRAERGVLVPPDPAARSEAGGGGAHLPVVRRPV